MRWWLRTPSEFALVIVWLVLMIDDIARQIAGWFA